MTSRPRRFRRAILGALGALAMFGPAAFGGCAASFSPASQLDSLRVVSVSIDKPYIAPSDPAACAMDPEQCTVHFDIEVYDGFGVRTQGSERPINVLWIGGCFDPQGDQYSLCVIPLLEIFKEGADALKEAAASGQPPKFPPGLPLGFGKSFSEVVPDIVSARPKPTFGPHYGVGYVFFLACAGHFGLVDPDPSAAGDFPIGCFDDDTNEKLGADSFVPGYTQIYSFEDGRLNENPPVDDVTFDGDPMSEDLTKIPVVKPCDVPAEDRNLPPSCSRQDPYMECTANEIDVDVPDDVGELDPDAEGEDGAPLREAVWVNYYADAGNFDSDIKLVSDSTTGLIGKRAVNWIPPAEPGLVTIWVVVRDARGGSTTRVRSVRVEK